MSEDSTKMCWKGFLKPLFLGDNTKRIFKSWWRWVYLQLKHEKLNPDQTIQSIEQLVSNVWIQFELQKRESKKTKKVEMGLIRSMIGFSFMEPLIPPNPR